MTKKREMALVSVGVGTPPPVLCLLPFVLGCRFRSSFGSVFDYSFEKLCSHDHFEVCYFWGREEYV